MLAFDMHWLEKPQGPIKQLLHTHGQRFALSPPIPPPPIPRFIPTKTFHLIIVLYLGFSMSHVKSEDLRFEVSRPGFEDLERGFAILCRIHEAQTTRVDICVWGSLNGAETSNPRPFVSGVRIFAPKPRSPDRSPQGELG